MKHLGRRYATRSLLLIAALQASSGMVFSQDELLIPLAPATDEVTVDGLKDNATSAGDTPVRDTPATESTPIESSIVPQDAAIPEDAAAAGTPIAPELVEQLPLEVSPPVDPQIENVLPPFNADEMAEEDRDDLLRGPVHEAFAEQVNSDPTPNMIVTQQPPEPVEELPPELKPDGREVEWISGYWAFDEDQDDFIWISGVWREIPQGFRWLPGYWAEVEGGFQWVSGTWVSTQTEEIQYLAEAPPETLELGPVGVAPASDQIWIPGTWMWNDTRYAWRPGYWSTGYENWVWVPARYQCTPRGYYHCHGYWDYPVNRRGVLFAPSYFNRRFRNNRITRFTPRVVVSTNLLTTHFWVRPRYRHYYFGNYYSVAYSNRGLMPWHQYPQQRRTFDPLYAYYSRGQRSNAYQSQLSVQFNLFVDQPNRRPAITFRDQDRWQRDEHRDIRPNDLLGNRFQNLVDNSTRDRSGLQFVRLENRQREQVQQETRQLRDLGNQRREVERSLTHLQNHHDGNLKTKLQEHEHEAKRVDLREQLDRRNESRGLSKDDPKSAGDANPSGNDDNDSGRNPLSKRGDSRDARPSSGGRDSNGRDGNGRDVKVGDGKTGDGNSRDIKVGDGKTSDGNGRDVKVGDGKTGDGNSRDIKVGDGKTGDGSGRDVKVGDAKTSDGNSRDVKVGDAKTGDGNNRDVKVGDGKRPGASTHSLRLDPKTNASRDRLKLPPATRSVDAKASAGATDSGKPAGTQNAARDQNPRAESRLRSAVEGSVNNAIKNAPAIRNSAEGRDRTRATDTPATNPPAIKREVAPRSTPATKSAPKIRPTPAERTTPAPRSAPSERATPAPRHEPGRATQNQGGGNSPRSERSVTPPRGDTGGRVRSNPAPAANPGRHNGGAGGGGAAAGRRGQGK